MIDTIIFDLGGVLIDWNPRYLYRTIFNNEADMELFLAEVCTGSWNEEQDRGRSLEEGTKIKLKEFPEYEKEIRAYYGRWDEMLNGTITKTEEILRTLYSSNRFRLYALTNWSHETFPIAWERYEALRLFEGILVSGTEKLKKPDHRIYTLLFERFDINPENALFIDDSEKNILSAKEMGLHTIHFTSSDSLEKDLKELGVL